MSLQALLNSRRQQQPAPQQQTSFNLGTSINGQPNYNIGLDVDPAMLNQPFDTMGRITSMPGTNARASRAAAHTQSVTDNQLMSNQLNSLLDEDSIYLQRARQQAMEDAAQRGLMNSSIAIGAGQGAAIDRAAPIAQFDAGRYGNVADLNQQAKNQASQLNAQLGTQTSISNANNRNRLQQLLAAQQFGAADDFRRHMLGIENREDSQAFGAGQADIDRFINDQQFAANLGLGHRQLDLGAFQANQQNLMSIANNIFTNTDLTAEQQAAAWNNVVNDVMPSISASSFNTIPPHLMSNIAGEQASNAVSRMPPMPPIDFGTGPRRPGG